MSEETAESRLTYAAFISYSHADNREEGRKWADWLHHELETYEVPADLIGKPNRAGKPIPAQIYPVFQDEKELSASSNLSSALTTALDASACLIYLSSPQSARSIYVSQELRHFKQTGKSDRMIALILAGEPEYGKESTEQQCFPEVLRFRVDETGAIETNVSEEPIAADARIPGTREQGFTTPEAYRRQLQQDRKLSRSEVERRVQAYKDRLDLARLKVIAGVLDVPLGDLTQRDQAYQLLKARQRTKIIKRIAIVIGVLAVMAMGMGVYAWTERNSAQSMLSRSLFLSGLNKIDQKEVAEGAAYMAAATRYGNERTALYVQSMLMRQNGMTLMPRLDSTPVFSPDGHWLAAINATTNAQRGIQIWDAYKQTLHTTLNDANANSFTKMLFDARGILYFTTADNKIATWQEGKPISIVYEAPADMRIASLVPDASGRWLVIQGWHVVDGKLEYIKSQLFNMRTHQLAVDQVPTRRRSSAATDQIEIELQGRLIVFHENEDNDNRIRIYPVSADGQLLEARDYQVPARIMRLKFSPDAQHVFVRAVNGMYHIDLRKNNREVARVPGQLVPEDVYFNDGKTYTTLWQGNYTVHDLNTDQPLSVGETSLNLVRLLFDDSSSVSPDMTQRVELQEGSFYLVTDLAPALLRSQHSLGEKLVSFRAMPDSKGVLILKKNGRALQYVSLEAEDGAHKYIETPFTIDRFGVDEEHDFIYVISTPENDRSQLLFYRASTGKPIGKPVSVKGMISFSRDGRQVSSRLDEEKLGIWDIASGELVRTFTLRQGEKYKLSADLSTILALDEQSNWRVVNVATGKVVHQESTRIKGAYFTPDNKYLLAFFNDNAQLYDLTDFVSRLTLPTAGDSPKAELSPDGKVIAMAEDNKYIRLWSLEKMRPIGQKIRNDATNGYLKFSADGQILFASDPLGVGGNKGIAMYDTTTGMPVVMPFGISRINDVVLLRNGKDILTLDARAGESILNVWAVPDALLAPARDLADQTEIYFGKQYDNDAAAVVDAPRSAQRPDSWFFQDPYVRPPVPGSTVSLTAYIEKYIPIRNASQLQLLDSYWRFHPMARAAMAVYFSQSRETGFVARRLEQMIRLQLHRVQDSDVKKKTLALLRQVHDNLQEHP